MGAAGGFGKRKMVGLFGNKSTYLTTLTCHLQYTHSFSFSLSLSLSLSHIHTYVHAYKHGLYELYTTYMRKPHPARPRDS